MFFFDGVEICGYYAIGGHLNLATWVIWLLVRFWVESKVSNQELDRRNQTVITQKHEVEIRY